MKRRYGQRRIPVEHAVSIQVLQNSNSHGGGNATYKLAFADLGTEGDILLGTFDLLLWSHFEGLSGVVRGGGRVGVDSRKSEGVRDPICECVSDRD